MEGLLRGVWVPGLPHILHPEKSAHWEMHYQAMKNLAENVSAQKPDVLIVYSTQWISVLGTSFQTHPHLKGVHVDENWYELGDLHFDFKTDPRLSESFAKGVEESGLPTKVVSYDQFPVDTGTIVALNFLNPNAQTPVCLVSSGVYCDSAASFKIGKIMHSRLKSAGKKGIFVASSLLSARYFTQNINPKEDRIRDERDGVWNRKILALLESGNLKEVEECAATFRRESVPDMQFNAFHWLSGTLSQNPVKGRVLSYGPIWGAGAAVVEFWS